MTLRQLLRQGRVELLHAVDAVPMIRHDEVLIKTRMFEMMGDFLSTLLSHGVDVSSAGSSYYPILGPPSAWHRVLSQGRSTVYPPFPLGGLSHHSAHRRRRRDGSACASISFVTVTACPTESCRVDTEFVEEC